MTLVLRFSKFSRSIHGTVILFVATTVKQFLSLMQYFVSSQKHLLQNDVSKMSSGPLVAQLVVRYERRCFRCQKGIVIIPL